MIAGGLHERSEAGASNARNRTLRSKLLRWLLLPLVCRNLVTIYIKNIIYNRLKTHCLQTCLFHCFAKCRSY